MLFFPSKSNSNPYLDDPDVVSMMAFIKGDKRAFEDIMERNYKRIFVFICRMTSDEVAAEDLTQEVFIKLYGMAHSYLPRAKLSTMLFQIARNTALNYLRSLKPSISIDETSEDSHAINPHQVLQQEELAGQVRLAIEALPENQRVAVLLRRYEDMSYEEIAQAMQTSPKAVKSLLNIAMDNLRISLKKVT